MLFPYYTDNPIMGDKSVLLVDFDETIFPFSAAYLRWVKGHYPGTKTATAQILSKELMNLPIHLRKMRHKLHLEKFVNNHDTLEIPPRQDATESLLLLSQKYRIFCCTNRRNMRGTIQWLEKHYSHVIEGIEHVEDSECTGKKFNIPTITKKYIVEKTHAVALIDDFAFNMWRLPPECRGFVVKREPPMPSDLGALSWSDIVKCLM